MPIDAKLVKVVDDHPRRCHAIRGTGNQCCYEAMEGARFCAIHGGPKAQKSQETENIRNYNIAKYNARIGELADSPKVKSLREEIGIMRMTLEGIVNRCQDEHDLLMYSSKISDMIVKIEKVVVSCNRLEVGTGQMLDRASAMQFAGEVIEIIGKYVTDPDAIESISDELLMSIGRISGNERQNPTRNEG